MMTIENIREIWNIAHGNITGDVIRAPIWLEQNHDEIIGFLLELVETLRKQLNANCLQRDGLRLELNELQHKVAETASACSVPHDNDFTAEETLNRIADWFLDLKREGNSL